MTMHGGASRAHPRSRGENWGGDACGVVAAGSSPLTRGKRSSLTDRQTPRPAHPRSRGENTSGRRSPSRAKGSSPLTRGKLHCIGNGRARHRLIPAHAGKTTTAPRRLSALWAHPRSRGENNPISSQRPARSGSSPLTRGKRAPRASRPVETRLIPAHAGKTQISTPNGPLRGAHPRSRGENPVLHFTAVCSVGSSPLTRGKHLGQGQSHQGRRLIPAHAGKTKALEISLRRCGAHPRSRGENPVRSRRLAATSGSSPLTRGKRVVGLLREFEDGLIPAHAGKTTCPP